jgi:hypothetical protein
MSIASQKGLIAAAGPDAVIVATTESVRKAFDGPSTDDNNVKPFTPQLKLSMPMRVSQLAFTADESYLVLSAEVGGGLAVYDVQALLQGSTTTAFEMPTNGEALRALLPNPTPEKGELLALVTTEGNLMMANLKERKFNTGPNGQVLKGGVSCVSWSTKGKQLVAGLANGSAYQMTPEGEGKADIPRPPSADMGDHGKRIPNPKYPSITYTHSIIHHLARKPLLPYGSHANYVRQRVSTIFFILRSSQRSGSSDKFHVPKDHRSSWSFWYESIPTASLLTSVARLSTEPARFARCFLNGFKRYRTFQQI